MNKQNNLSQKGYIALMSAIIVSFVLIGVVFVANTSGYFARFDSQNSEYKRIALGLAESCANVALLKVAYDPSYIPPVGGETVPVGLQTCVIKSIDNPITYDSDNKKTVVVFTEGQYQGAFSNISVASTVLDPNHAPAAHAALTVIVQTVNNYGGTAQPGSFTVNVAAGDPTQSTFLGATSGTTVFIDPGPFNITETPLANYHTDYLNSNYPFACSGTAYVNQSYVCVITNIDLPTTFSLTAAANVTRAYQVEPAPSNLQLSLSGPVNQVLVSGVPVSDLPSGSYTVSLSGVPSGYTVSPWGEDCAAPGTVSWAPGDKRYKTCAINIVEDPPPVSNRAALTIVERILNYNGGTAQPPDFTVNILAVNPTQTTFPGAASTTILIDPGDFEVSQPTLVNYQTPQYLNASYPYLCQGTAVAGQSFLCLITNYDIVSSFILTTTVNITRAYGVAPEPNYTLALDGPAGHKVLTSGVAQSDLPSGNYSLSLAGIPSTYSVSQWGADCSSTGAVSWAQGDKRYKTCAINIVENPPPFNNVDTVMMLDRTGSMAGADLTNEGAAARSFIDMFAGAGSLSKVGVGSFGGLNGSWASVPVAGQLSTNYSGLKNVVNQIIQTTTIGTNISAAIDAGNIELASSRHDPAKKKFMLLVSDGEANRPCPASNPNCPYSTSQTSEDAAFASATVAKNAGVEIYAIHYGAATAVPPYAGTNQDFLAALATNSTVDHFIYSSRDTGFLSPTSYATGDSWTNPTGAYSSGGGAATDNAGHRERYYRFNIPSLTNNLIDGIEIKADSWVSGNSVDTGYISPVANAVDTGGDNNGFEQNPSGAYTDGNGNAANIDGAGDRHRYYGYNFNLPAGAVITGIETRLDWWINSNYGSNSMSVDLSWDGGNNWTSPLSTISEPTYEATSILGGAGNKWGHSWTSNDFEASNFRVRVTANSNYTTRDFYLDWIPVKVYYILLVNPACQLGVDISWGAGNSNTWSSEQTKTLAGSLESYTFGGASDKWGSHDWQTSELTNTNFYARVHYIDPDPGDNTQCADGAVINLDWLQAKIYYRVKTVDVAAENADGDHFFIAPTTDQLPAIFNMIGQEIISAETPPTATKGTLNVITHVINNGGHTKTASDFAITVTGSNPAPAAFAGAEAPGVTVTIDPGSYSITENADSDYVETIDPQCSGTIAAGQEITCIIINDDTAPAALPPPPPPPPPPSPPPSATNSTIYIITHVINDNGKSKIASDFPITVTGDSPNPDWFGGQEAPGVTVTLNPGAYSVTEPADSDYMETVGQGCSGTITLGQAVTCTIINDDNPPPVPPPPLPPPPPPNIDIGSWEEKPNSP